MVKFTLIAAMSEETRAIGYNNNLLWHIPADLQHFKALTLGQVVLMGSHTWRSLGSKPLRDRYNLVLSSGYIGNGAQVVKTLDAVMRLERDRIFVIGGESIYRQFLPFADRVELSLVNGCHVGDRHFPAFEADFLLTNSQATDWGRFTTWKRQNNAL